MRPLFLIIFCMISSALYAGPGGGGGGSVREASYFKEQTSIIYHGMNKSVRLDNRSDSEGSTLLDLVELEAYLPIAKIQTINGEIITKENVPNHYPIGKIQSIEMENGQILFVEDILELLTNDNENPSSI